MPPSDDIGPGRQAAAAAPLEVDIRGIFVRARQMAANLRNEGADDWGDRPMPAWDGGYDGHRECKPIWPRIAEFCLRNQVDPETLVRAQFELIQDRMPRPTDCLGQGALERYTAYDRASEERLAQALANQKTTFRLKVAYREITDGVTREHAAVRVLEDPLVQLSGLFRHCSAAAIGESAIADRYADDALVQYLFRRAVYDRVWGPLIPRALRARAEKYAKSPGVARQ